MRNACDGRKKQKTREEMLAYSVTRFTADVVCVHSLVLSALDFVELGLLGLKPLIHRLWCCYVCIGRSHFLIYVCIISQTG
jgi:hypothetical protein